MQMQALHRFAATVLALFVGITAHAASNVVELTRDAAGNITQIVRQATGGLAVTGFSPTSGAVSDSVTVYGAGFSSTPANNTVKFNGVTASVTASDAGSIATTVPSGATTGPVSVTVGGITATSAQSFVVTIPGAPTITSFTPAYGASSASVSKAGPQFERFDKTALSHFVNYFTVAQNSHDLRCIIGKTAVTIWSVGGTNGWLRIAGSKVIR
jgi:hypothetical protein